MQLITRLLREQRGGWDDVPTSLASASNIVPFLFRQDVVLLPIERARTLTSSAN